MKISEYRRLIREAVTVPRMLEFYGFDLGRKDRIKCPIHNGTHQNFGYTDKVWHCFVCGAKGDVFSFVQQYFNLNPWQTVEKISDDFNLGFDPQPYPGLRAARERQKPIKAAADKAKERAKELERLEIEYWRAFSAWKTHNTIKKALEPHWEESFDTDGIAVYLFACRKCDEAEYRLEEAGRRLYDYERGIRSDVSRGSDSTNDGP